MVLENDILPFGEWIVRYAPSFLVMVLVLLGMAVLAGFLLMAVRRDPVQSADAVGRFMAQALVDLRNVSLRRVLAMARLAVKEALRNYVLVVFGVFAIILLFGGWFLDSGSDNPARLYISFVLNATNFLVILLTIFLSAFSLPNDVKNRTIYTVVTKPVRAWEIVVGRILGFVAIGTMIIGILCVVSYFFVVRGLQHTHGLEGKSLRSAEDFDGEWVGRTSFDHGHRHDFSIDSDGRGISESVHGHYHGLSGGIEGGKLDASKVVVGAPWGALQARVPIYGDLRYLNRKGLPGKGDSIGKEWSYRRYVPGRTLAAGIWRFHDLNGSDFLEGLPLEMSIRVFRTYQGDMNRGILGSMELRNPNPALWSDDPTARAALPRDTAVKSRPISFTAQDTVPEARTIPRVMECQLLDGSLRKVDIFEELVHEGSLEFLVRCDERNQYFGMAKTDLYIRAADRSFFVNFLKSYITIWLQMVVVASLGVMFSTFLTGAVAMMATSFALVVGFYSSRIVEIATGQAVGGGPMESLIRIIRQLNLVTDLGSNPAIVVVKIFDVIAMFMMRMLTFLAPNFRDYSEFRGLNTARFAAYGFDIPASLMWEHVCITLAYVVLASFFGYIFLKSREVAA